MTRRSKHVSFVIVPILYKTRDPKSLGRLQLLMVSPVIPGVTTILFCQLEKTSMHFKLKLTVHTS